MRSCFLLLNLVVFTSFYGSAAPRCKDSFSSFRLLTEQMKQQLKESYFIYAIRSSMTDKNIDLVKEQYPVAEAKILDMTESYIVSVQGHLESNNSLRLPKSLIHLHNQVSRRVEVLSHTQSLVPIAYRNPQWPMQTKQTREVRRVLFYLRKDLENRLPTAAE